MLGKWSFVMLLLVSIAGIAQAETRLKQLGVNPFYTPEIKSRDALRQMVKETRMELKNGFNQAGAADLFDDFVAQVGQSEIREIDINPGERLQWMIFRKGPTAKVVKDVVWAGMEPFAAFLVHVDKAGVRYTFVVPAKCGNVSLAMTQPVPVATAVSTAAAAESDTSLASETTLPQTPTETPEAEAFQPAYNTIQQTVSNATQEPPVTTWDNAPASRI